MAKDYEIRVVEEALMVVEFLAEGDILGWKSVQEVVNATGISSKDRAFRILCTLSKCGWAEQGKRGFRQHRAGLMKHLVYAQNYVERLEEQLGVRRLG